MAKNSRKCLKICCGVTALIIIIFIIVAVVLFLTILKPKQPKISTESVTLQQIRFFPFPFFLNVSLGIVVRVDNRNYGSFKYQNSTAYISYRGTVVAEAPIENDTIPARKKHDISTTMVINGEKLASNPSLAVDVLSGRLNFTSATTLHGKATVLKLLKVKATSYSTCDISLVLLAQNITTVCDTKVKY